MHEKGLFRNSHEDKNYILNKDFDYFPQNSNPSQH